MLNLTVLCALVASPSLASASAPVMAPALAFSASVTLALSRLSTGALSLTSLTLTVTDFSVVNTGPGASLTAPIVALVAMIVKL